MSDRDISSFRSFIHLTMAGSRCEKKLLVPVSSVAIYLAEARCGTIVLAFREWRPGLGLHAVRPRSAEPAMAHRRALHGAQATQVAVGQLAQQLNQQAILLASLDYFGFLMVFSLIGAVTMVAQRVLK